MSKTIDQRVVEMRFDNANFEKNVSTSMSTLDKLKKSLRFEDSAKGFENISKAAGRVDMGGLAGGVESVRLKFSALEVMAVTALSNITSKAVDTGLQLVKSLSIDQITAGWDKFASKTSSVATLVAQGYGLSEVSDQLDRLNWFTDETSYNFTDMVANIAKFTATGKGLTESVTAMEGIANWAALSSQNAQTASHAMYQLSQAMGAGVMRKEDYKSIQNASMDTEEFRQKCLDAAVALGTLKKNSDGTYKSLVADVKDGNFTISQFAEHLTQDAWFTSDVMMKVFGDYSAAVDQIYEYADEKGITASQAIEELGDSVDAFGLKAFKAAQEARSWGDAVDSVKDAVSTGWMQTFELIFGNQKEATQLWTNLANSMYDVFASSGEARNELLKEWKNLGGRDALLEGFWNSWNAFFGDGDKYLGILGSIKEAFAEIFPPLTGERLAEITEKFRDLTEKFKMSDETAKNLKNTFKGVFAVFDIGRQGIGALGEIFKHLLSQLLPVGNGFLGLTGNLGEFLVSLDETIKEGDGLKKFVETVNGVIDKLISGFKTAKDHVVDFISSWSGIDSIKDFLHRAVSGISGFFSDIVERAKGSGDIVSAVGDSIKKTAETIWNVLKAVFGWISDNVSIGDIFTGLAGGGVFVAAKKFTGLIEKIKDAIENLFGNKEDSGIKGKFAEVMDSIHDTLSSFSDGIKVSSIVAVAVAVGILSASMKAISDLDVGEITKSVVAIGIMLGMLGSTMKSISKTLKGLGSSGLVKSGVSLVLIAAALSILAGAMKKVADLSIGDIAKGLIALGGGLVELSLGLKIIGKTKINLRTSIAMIALAASCSILADALKKFSVMSWNEIGRGLTAMGGAITELVIAMSALNKFGGGKSILGSVAILISVQSLSKLADALKKFGEMSWDIFGRGLSAMGGALGELGIVLGLLGKLARFSSIFAAGAILMVVHGLDDLADALKKFGSMTWDEITHGLSGMGGALGEVALITGLLGGLTGFSSVLGAGAILLVIQGLDDLASAFQRFAGMSWDGIVRGLSGMGGALAEVGIVTGLLGGLTGLSGLIGAGALLLAIQGLTDLADAFKSFGQMSWDEIGRGLVGMGGALGEVAIITGALGAIAGLPALLGSGAILLAIQGLGDLADAFKSFGQMSWDEIGRGLVGMGGALGEVAIITGALGAIAGLPALLGSGAILLAIQGLGDLADALKKFGEMSWDEIGRGLSAMGGALGEVALGGVLNTLSGLGALSISAIAEPLGTLADSVKKWTGVTIPDGLTLQLAALAAGISAFTFSGIGAVSLATAAESLGTLADSVRKWTNVTIPDGLVEKMATLAAGIEKFTFAGLGAGALSAAAPGVGEMADSIKKWSTVTIPDGLENGLRQIANGVKSFSFAFVGGWSLSAITGPLGELATSVRKWKSVSISDDLEDGLKRIADGIKAFSWAFIGGWSLSAIIDPLSDLADSVKKWNGVSIPADLGGGLDTLADGVKAFNWAFLGGWSLGAITGPLGTLADSVKKWKNVSIPQNLGDDLSRLAEGITAFSSVPDVSIVASSVNTISTAAMNLSKTDFSTFSIGVKSLTDSIKELASIDSIDASFVKLGNEIVKELITPIKNAPNQFKTAGTNLIKSLLTGINSQTSTVVAKAKEITTKMASAISSQKSRFRTSGSDLIKEVSSGVSGQTGMLKNQFSTLLNNCVAAVRGYYSQFQSAGSYLAAGIANGISANAGAVANASANMASRASSAARSRLQIKSPSKVGYKIGDYFGIGFTNGITDNIRNAGLSSDALAESATTGLSNAVSKIATLIDSGIDTNPTIRPVLDLTEIQNGSAAMADLMSTLSGRPVEGTVSIAAKTANSMNRTAFAPEHQTETTSGKQTSENTTNNFYITGTDPRAIADEVDRKLQRRVERKKAAWA